MKAFPSLYVHFNKTNEMSEPRLVANSHHGMDLRDYFAAKAMQELIHIFAEDSLIDDADQRRSVVAKASYKQADAMMKAREQ